MERVLCMSWKACVSKCVCCWVDKAYESLPIRCWLKWLRERSSWRAKLTRSGMLQRGGKIYSLKRIVWTWKEGVVWCCCLIWRTFHCADFCCLLLQGFIYHSVLYHDALSHTSEPCHVFSECPAAVCHSDGSPHILTAQLYKSSAQINTLPHGMKMHFEVHGIGTFDTMVRWFKDVGSLPGRKKNHTECHTTIPDLFCISILNPCYCYGTHWLKRQTPTDLSWGHLSFIPNPWTMSQRMPSSRHPLTFAICGAFTKDTQALRDGRILDWNQEVHHSKSLYYPILKMASTIDIRTFNSIHWYHALFYVLINRI